MRNILKVENLSIRLKKGPTIVDNVTFKLKKGSILGISGESGSGKTMTSRALLNLLDLDRLEVSGHIIFKGKRYEYAEWIKNAEERKKMSMVMQNPMTAFDPVSKIGNQMVETLRSHRQISKKEALEISYQKLEEIGFAETKRILDSYPYMLSGGMLQRIMIALALLSDSEVLIADEATTALDVCTQAIILERFKRIRNQGISIMLITHDFGVLAQLADDAIILNKGRVVERGNIYRMFDAPQSRYTKELLTASFLRRENNDNCRKLNSKV